jgi:hypothetical protein
MVPEQPLTSFLSWVTEDPDRLERYPSSEGFHDLLELWEFDLPEDLQEILETNDLQAALEVIRREIGEDNVYGFVIMFVIMYYREEPPPPPPPQS